MPFFTTRKYYVVTCKFGHVGRDKFLPLDIPVKAINKKEASAKAKKTGGVKRDHPDWCLKGPTEITREEYDVLRKKLSSDPYWNKKTRQNVDHFRDRLINEPNYTNIRGVKTNTVTFKKPTPVDIKIYRKKYREIKESDLDAFMLDSDED